MMIEKYMFIVNWNLLNVIKLIKINEFKFNINFVIFICCFILKNIIEIVYVKNFIC